MSTPPAAHAKQIIKYFNKWSNKTGFFGNPTWYPLQFASAASGESNHGADATEKRADYYGEIRAFYPDSGAGYVQPWNSMFHTRVVWEANVPSGQPPMHHRKHRGLDLYAPYHPYPFEIPVYAIIDGQLEQRSQYSRWNSLGNRADITFSIKVAGKDHKYVLSYGHLSRFAPVPENRRTKYATAFSIKAGELIGYIGKSGNADRSLESSSRKLAFRMNSAHIHLSVRRTVGEVTTTYDPLPLLKDRFAYRPSKDELFPGGDLVEREAKGRHFATASFAGRLRTKMPQIKPVEVTLQSGEEAGIRVNAQTPGENGKVPSRVPFPGIFRTIDTNNSRHLRATAKAYEFAHKRLKSKSSPDQYYIRYAMVGPPLPQPRYNHDYEVPYLFNYLNNYSRTVWGDTLDDYAERAKDHASKMVSTVDGKRAWHLCASLHILHEALWVLMLGPAYQAFGRQWAPASKGEPQTGIGLRGRVLATQFQESVAALHISSIPRKTTGEAVKVYSVTFGSGGLRHATLPSAKALDAEHSTQKQYINRVIGGIYRPLSRLHGIIRTHSKNFASGQTPATLQRWISTLADRAAASSDDPVNNPTPRDVLNGLVAGVEQGSLDGVEKFFAPIAELNHEVFDVAHRLSNRRDRMLPTIGPMAPPHQPDLEWIGHSGDLKWTKATGEERYG